MKTVLSFLLLKEKIVYQIHRTFIGFGLLIASWALGLLGLVGVLGSIFFAIAKIPLFTQAAAITGGISILIAIIVAIEGVHMLRTYHH